MTAVRRGRLGGAARPDEPPTVVHRHVAVGRTAAAHRRPPAIVQGGEQAAAMRLVGVEDLLDVLLFVSMLGPTEAQDAEGTTTPVAESVHRFTRARIDPDRLEQLYSQRQVPRPTRSTADTL